MPTSKPRRASVDTAFALDEVPQRLIQVLEFCRVGAFAKAVAQITIKA
jgi:hypothetical protein